MFAISCSLILCVKLQILLSKGESLPPSPLCPASAGIFLSTYTTTKNRTSDIYSRILKHCGAKVHGRFHPALTETPADARLVDLSSPMAIQLFDGGKANYEGDAGE